MGGATEFRHKGKWVPSRSAAFVLFLVKPHSGLAKITGHCSLSAFEFCQQQKIPEITKYKENGMFTMMIDGTAKKKKH